MNINSRTSKINFTGYTSGSPATFTGLRVAHVKIRSFINPIQTGSGNPAPDNIRPISGRNSVTITANSVDNVISLGDTYYGGVFDVTNGVLRVDKRYAFFDGSSDEEWTLINGGFYLDDALAGLNVSTNKSNPKCICNKYIENNAITNSSLVPDRDDMSFFNQTTRPTRLWVKDSNCIDETSFKAALSSNPLQLVYPIAVPYTIQLSPEEIYQIIGSNSISSDSGTVEVYYVTI